MKILWLLVFVFGATASFAQKADPEKGDIIVIKSGDASKYLGKTVSICDMIVSGADLNLKAKSDPTQLYVGGDVDKDYFLVVIRDNDRSAFSYDPKERLINKKYCITGKMLRYKGKPAIFVTSEKQITAQ